MSDVSDLSRKVISLARALDRLPPGEYAINLIKPKSRNQDWVASVDKIQPRTDNTRMIVTEDHSLGEAEGVKL